MTDEELQQRADEAHAEWVNETEIEAELLKWKSRCASLTAEVVCLRGGIESKDAVTRHALWESANKIKSEREAEIIKDAAASEVQAKPHCPPSR